MLKQMRKLHSNTYRNSLQQHMKQLALNLLAICALVLPISAASTPASFGGFTKGQQFTFRVNEKTSASSVNGVINPQAPVPKGIPNFSVGQSVTFVIGSKGELTGPGFKIPFKADGGSSNVYATLPSRKNPTPNSAIVFKNMSTQAPLGTALTFYMFGVKARVVTVYTVTYTLNP